MGANRPSSNGLWDAFCKGRETPAAVWDALRPMPASFAPRGESAEALRDACGSSAASAPQAGESCWGAEAS